MFHSGLRQGELLALMYGRIDFKNKKVKILNGMTSKTKQKGRKLTTTKNSNSTRVIDMDDTMFDILKRRSEYSKKLDGFNDNYFVFGDIRPISPNAIAHRLDKYIKLSGVHRITPHGFRHSHATFLINATDPIIPDVLIAERLGHTVKILQETYAHIYSKRRTDMTNYLNTLGKSKQ